MSMATTVTQLYIYVHFTITFCAISDDLASEESENLWDYLLWLPDCKGSTISSAILNHLL